MPTLNHQICHLCKCKRARGESSWRLKPRQDEADHPPSPTRSLLAPTLSPPTRAKRGKPKAVRMRCVPWSAATATGITTWPPSIHPVQFIATASRARRGTHTQHTHTTAAQRRAGINPADPTPDRDGCLRLCLLSPPRGFCSHPHAGFSIPPPPPSRRALAARRGLPTYLYPSSRDLVNPPPPPRGIWVFNPPLSICCARIPHGHRRRGLGGGG